MKKPEITDDHKWALTEDGLEVWCGDELICTIAEYVPRHSNEQWANATAIRAVPDMIDALIEAYEMHGNAIQELGYDPSKDPTIGKIKQALIKAGCTE